MIPINNSDTAWLIVCDYNQDNNLPHEELREDVLNPDVNHYDIIIETVGVGAGFNFDVGGCYSNTFVGYQDIIEFGEVGEIGLTGFFVGGYTNNLYPTER